MKRVEFIDNVTLGGLIDEVNISKDSKVAAVNETRTIAVLAQGSEMGFANDFSLFNVGTFLKVVRKLAPESVYEDEHRFRFINGRSTLQWVKGNAGLARTLKSKLNIGDFINSAVVEVEEEQAISLSQSLLEILSYDIEGFLVFESNDSNLKIKIMQDEHSHLIEKELELPAKGKLLVRILKENARAVFSYLSNSNLELQSILVGNAMPLVIVAKSEYASFYYLVSNVVEVEE